MRNQKGMPVSRGHVKVPVVMQLEALECGAACLAMILAYYGKWVPLDQVRADCGVSRDGSRAGNIYRAAVHYGLAVEAYSMSPEEIREAGKFPCIIHWNMNHFVVLNGFSGRHAWINDPARGEVRVDWDEFDDAFTGVVLIPVPGEDFVPDGRKKSTVDFARARLAGAGAAVAFVTLTTVISYLFGIGSSVMSRIFMDRLLTGVNPDWLMPFTMAMAVFAAVQLVIEWIRTAYSLKINGKMAVIGSTSYMWKVLRLPMQFFSQRLIGDIQSRLSLNASIAGTLVGTFAPLFLNTAMMVFYLVLMLRQSIALTAVGIFVLTMNIFLSRLISEKRVNVTRVLMRDAGKMETTTVTGIGMLETIKSSGAEEGFFQKWAGYQADVNAGIVKAARINEIFGMLPALLGSLSGTIVLLLGIRLAMSGEFTLGSVMMFQGFLSSFMGPAQTLVSAGQTIQEMRTSMERVEDVMEYPEDPALTEHAKAGEWQKLSGQVELKHVTFGYSPLEKPLIRDFSLTIEPGQQIAVVGASGCGKSTLSRLVSGLWQPWEGEILFDGKKRSEIPREVMTGSLAVVDQDITLFEDTISANIRMWDESIQDFEMILAARDAQLHDDICALPGGYQYVLSGDGRNLSGGQRQRLEIARVLAQDPTILILDEATSALDAVTEHEVVEAIRARGITCLIIAHRLSTIRDCDRILVLENGVITEQGTHEELMRRKGAYAELVSSE